MPSRRLPPALALALVLVLLAACVTHAPSPVGDAFLRACAPPALTVRFADPDGLPSAYDEAVHAVSPAAGAPVRGHAARTVEARIAAGLRPRLAAFEGDAACTLDVAVENVILPDATRYTPLSGMKSFAVAVRLTGPDGRVLAETTRPMTVLSDMQRRGGRFSGSAWSRPGDTDALRAEVVAGLSDATARVVGEAVTGGRTQTGLSGRLVAYPERLPR